MCAIFGIVDHHEASSLCYLGLHSLQHRGQEGAGIVSTDGSEPFAYRKKGHVSEVFSSGTLHRLKGTAAIGHTRYSTTGANTMANLQPLLMKSGLGWVAVSHNGNLINAPTITANLEKQGSIFQSTNDTEVIIHLMARSGQQEISEALIHALKLVEGAYSLLVLSRESLIAVRDPYGFRPLITGTLNGSRVFASESCAFDLIGAKYEREIEPGEMMIVPFNRPKGLKSLFPFEKKERKRCVFEYIYLARPDSLLFGENVHEMRKALGRKLAKEQPAPDAEVVLPVPDSGVAAAIGFAEESKIPFDMGIIRSHYIGRTFIEPRQSTRDVGVRLKLNAVGPTLKNKSIVVVDDSVVRGTTSRKIMKMLREAGARKIHFRVSAPPTTHSCFYGIDTPTRQELLASSSAIEAVRQFIGCDTIGYLSLEGLMEVAENKAGKGFCHACFSGKYPTESTG
ncbi:MAG: amidophosphoribosyltransferase [Deltaproteobacteria bacterium]|nr:amidophosphoribosyltransferase [Deltaproteobacteria bacterium]